MQKVKLITDSSCDLPKELMEKHNIDLLAMSIIFDGKAYRDYYELDNKSFLDKLKVSNSMPTTTMPDHTEMKNAFQRAIDNGQSAIYVTLSSKASGTNNLAHLVKKELEDHYGKPLDITIIDSLSFSLVIGRAVLEAALMAEQNEDKEEVIAHIYEILRRTSVRFIVNDLTYLKNGGRIKAGTALISGVLGITPILTINDGLVIPIAKERGMKKAIQKLINDIKSDIPSLKFNDFWIINCDNAVNANILKHRLEEEFQVKEIRVFDTYATISTHAGPGVCAVFYIK